MEGGAGGVQRWPEALLALSAEDALPGSSFEWKTHLRKTHDKETVVSSSFPGPLLETKA